MLVHTFEGTFYAPSNNVLRASHVKLMCEGALESSRQRKWLTGAFRDPLLHWNPWCLS